MVVLIHYSAFYACQKYRKRIFGLNQRKGNNLVGKVYRKRNDSQFISFKIFLSTFSPFAYLFSCLQDMHCTGSLSLTPRFHYHCVLLIWSMTSEGFEVNTPMHSFFETLLWHIY